MGGWLWLLSHCWQQLDSQFTGNHFQANNNKFHGQDCKTKNEVSDIFIKCSYIFASSVFIELSNSSSSDDLTFFLSLTKSSKGIF